MHDFVLYVKQLLADKFGERVSDEGGTAGNNHA